MRGSIRAVGLARFVAGVVGIVVVTALGVVDAPAADPPALTPRELPKIVISRETTYLTGPLDPNGGVDYLAAMREKLSAGVTPENNFAVPFWKVMGPEHVHESHRQAYFAGLGMQAPPEDGDYYVRALDYLDGNLLPGTDLNITLTEAIQTALDKPWTAKSHPWLMPWLNAHDKHLDALAAAAERTRFYEPLTLDAEVPMLAGIRLEVAAEALDASEGLCLRAMHRAGNGKLDAACDDLIASDRIGRLLGQGQWAEEIHIGHLVIRQTDATIAALLEHSPVTADHVRRLRRARNSATPLKGLSEMFGDAERLISLDLALRIRVGGLKPWLKYQAMLNESFVKRRSYERYGLNPPDEDEVTVKRPNPFQSVVDAILKKDVDWNEVLRDLNKRYDKFAECAPFSYKNRQAELHHVAKDAKPRTLNDLLRDDEFVKVDAVHLAARLATSNNLPEIKDIDDGLTELAVRRRLTDLALELADHRLRHGKYPERLAELAVPENPTSHFDPFTEGELRYRREGAGYLLYSLGKNGFDDGARTYEFGEKTSEPHWDDVALRMPKPQAEKKK